RRRISGQVSLYAIILFSMVRCLCRDTSTTDSLTLSLHVALPICGDPGVLADSSTGVEWIIRHNTVVQISSDAAFQHVGSQIPWSVFENNIIYIADNYAIQTSILPINVDGNVMWLTGTAMIAPNQLYTWAQWQASGRDLNGLNADPLLMNTTPGFEDLRLQPGSPARDFLQVGSVQEDVFGNPRP